MHSGDAGTAARIRKTDERKRKVVKTAHRSMLMQLVALYGSATGLKPLNADRQKNIIMRSTIKLKRLFHELNAYTLGYLSGNISKYIAIDIIVNVLFYKYDFDNYVELY